MHLVDGELFYHTHDIIIYMEHDLEKTKNLKLIL
jgi:hypothetical protein